VFAESEMLLRTAPALAGSVPVRVLERARLADALPSISGSSVALASRTTASASSMRAIASFTSAFF
jgi:hypothetical protein